MEAETTRCRTKEHPEFRLTFDERDPTVAQIAPSILSWLEDQVLAGVRYRPGESIQIGWMYDELFERPDGTVGIREPDFQTVPVAWADSLTLTLRHLWFQKETALSVSLEPDFPSYLQSAIVCTELRASSTIFMHRTEATGSDSGWFIGCSRAGHDHQDVKQLTRVSLFEAAVAWNGRFIPYAALPTGCYVVEQDGHPRISRNDEWLAIRPNTLLAAWGQKP